MINYILLFISILFVTTNNLSLKFLAYKKINYNPFLFNAFVSFIWVVILLLFNLGFKGASLSTFIYGLIYGLALSLLLVSKAISISNGPVSLATLVGASSFIVSNLFNAIYFKEQLGFFEISGMVVMLIAVIFMAYKKEKHFKPNLVYVLSLIIIFISGAAVGIIFKFHQTVDKIHSSEMMIFAGLFSLIFSLFFYFVFKRKMPISFPWKEASKKTKFTFIITAFIVGIASCVYCRLNINLVGELPSGIFFPIFNGTYIALVSVLASLMFKEKLKPNTIIGCIFGVFAVILVSRIFGAF